MSISITVSDELVEHFAAVKDHRDNVLRSNSSEDKDKVAALNAVTSILKDLAKIQETIYNTEKIAQLQMLIITALQEADQETADRILHSLEKHLTME